MGVSCIGVILLALAADEGHRVIDGCQGAPIVIDAEDPVTVDVRPPEGVTCAAPPAAQVVTAVRVLGTDLAHEVPAVLFTQTAFAPSDLQIGFAPGESWSLTGVEVDVVPGQRAGDVVIDVATVSVMQCNNEGPHVEFWGQHEQVSPWVPWRTKVGVVATKRTVRTSTPMPSVPVASPPHPWSKPELRAALHKVVGIDADTWPLDLCRPIEGELRVRVRVRVAGELVPVTTLRLRPALGC
jgi:hypothetical protein